MITALLMVHDRKPFWQVALLAAFWEVPLVYGLVAEQVIRWRDARAK
jgi:hypothetical protein